MTLDEYFAGHEDSRRLFESLSAVIKTYEGVDMRVTKSQIAFRRRRTFAWAWMPGKYLRGKAAPLVLTVSLSNRDGSPRWKEIVEPYPGRFVHHLEIYTSAEIDRQVCEWLRMAWTESA